LFQALVDGMTYLINLCYGFTVWLHLPNYGLAIVFLTTLIKLVLYPLSLKQMHSVAVMQKLAPQIKEIQTKYKEKDPQKMQKKMMELYQEHNVNPLSGCLPLLIQFPILIALYKALLHLFNEPDLAHANFLWISNLGIKGDPFFILPILAGVSTYFQTRMTMTANDPTQKMMLYTMPLFIAWICTTVPAGLALYWTVFNILGIVQQYFINKQTMGLKEAASESGSGRKSS